MMSNIDTIRVVNASGDPVDYSIGTSADRVAYSNSNLGAEVTNVDDALDKLNSNLTGLFSFNAETATLVINI